jgi:hypothetical protein
MTPDDEFDDEFDDGFDGGFDDGSRDGFDDDQRSGRGVEGSRPPSPAAAAVNWRTVAAADVGMGAAVVVVGVVLAFLWHPVIGGGIASLGLVYLVLAARRAAEWADWRRRNGLK